MRLANKVALVTGASAGLGLAIAQRFGSEGAHVYITGRRKDALDAASGTMARDEWIKQKMDTRQYKSSDLYGTPRDPALRKEMDDYIQAQQTKKPQ